MAGSRERSIETDQGIGLPEKFPNPEKVPLEGLVNLRSRRNVLFFGGSGGDGRDDFGDRPVYGRDDWIKRQQAINDDRQESYTDAQNRDDRRYEDMTGVAEDTEYKSSRFDQRKQLFREKINGKWTRWRFYRYLED